MPKKPLILHQIDGTGRRNRLAKRERELTLDSRAPQPPEWLLPEAKAEWARIVAESRYAPALASVDRGLLSVYCQMWARFVASQTGGKEFGGRQLQMLVVLAGKFGLNPTDRAKITLPAKPKPNDPWAMFDTV